MDQIRIRKEKSIEECLILIIIRLNNLMLIIKILKEDNLRIYMCASDRKITYKISNFVCVETI